MTTDADLYALAERLYPIPRCLMGPAVEETLNFLDAWIFVSCDGSAECATRHRSRLVRTRVPTGTRVFDWTVPPEWTFGRVLVTAPDGTTCFESADPSVVVRYSARVDEHMGLDDLARHVHLNLGRSTARQYRTSYYDANTWGLCLTEQESMAIPRSEGDYRVVIDVDHTRGHLTWSEALIPGETQQEVLLSTYCCHPSLANDNVSGMVVTAALAKWLASAPRRYSYHILFAPETIGALAWLASLGEAWRALPELQQRVVAGYTINCVGDERAWSFLPSRKGNTLADRAARHVLGQMVRPGGWIAKKGDGMQWAPFITEYPFTDRGSDERQFCAPGVDLPIASVMRSKHGTFPEYHTSADDLSVISAKGLGDSFRCYQRIIETIEANRVYRVTTIGEPMLSKHNLYPTSGGPDERAKVARDLCAYADGGTDLIAIAEATGRPVWDLAPVAALLEHRGLLTSEPT